MSLSHATLGYKPPTLVPLSYVAPVFRLASIRTPRLALPRSQATTAPAPVWQVSVPLAVAHSIVRPCYCQTCSLALVACIPGGGWEAGAHKPGWLHVSHGRLSGYQARFQAGLLSRLSHCTGVRTVSLLGGLLPVLLVVLSIPEGILVTTGNTRYNAKHNCQEDTPKNLFHTLSLPVQCGRRGRASKWAPEAPRDP